MNFRYESYLLSSFHLAKGPLRFLCHWPKGPAEMLVGYGARSRGHGAGSMGQGSGEYWWPAVPRSGLVLPGQEGDTAGRAAGCPALAPTAPACVAETGGRMGMLLTQPGLLQHHLGQAQARCPADGPQETGQDLLLECSGGHEAEQSASQTLSWN